MYSPKISEDLIPALYQLAKEKKKPMTHVVDEMLRKALEKEITEGRVPSSSSDKTKNLSR